MDALKSEIDTLVARLGKCAPDSGIELQALTFLKRLAADAEKAVFPEQLAGRFADLTLFWRDIVPWCSELSKDIEKLIIMHGDLL